ncbi:MAG: oligosaccharide flippase family protein [Oligoflexia bacterium]|nr:oligosaccharide flippase family protein [Oligoflexia bacterium]
MALFLIRRDLVVLAGTTFTSAALNLLQSVVVTRALGVENFGVVGLVASVCAVVLCFVDFRIYDVTAKLYLADSQGSPMERVNVLHIGAMIQFLVATLALLLSVALSNLVLPYVANTPIDEEALIALSLATACNYFCGYFTTVQRLSGRVIEMALYQLFATALGVSVLCTALAKQPGLDSYCAAIVLSSAASGLVNFLAYLRLFRISTTRFITLRTLAENYRRVFREHRVLLYSNLLGYLKLLSRAGDTLLVGALCNDYHTGLYKFGRSLTDSLSLIYEIAVKFYQPLFLKASAEGNAQKFKKFSRGLLQAAVFIGIAIIFGEVLFLKDFLKLFFAPGFGDSYSMVLVLSIPVIFSLGVNLWLWPLLLSCGKMRFYTLVSFSATLLFQYAIPALVQIFSERVDSLLFAFGYTLSFALTYILCLMWVKRQMPEYSPL